MDIAAAIRLLRPEFNLRENLRTALQQLIDRNTTYFSTVPKDITNIVVSFVPLLQVGANTGCAVNLLQDRENFAGFLAKYQIADEDMEHPKHPNRTYLSRNKLVQDFPEHILLLMGDKISIKLIDNKLYVANYMDLIRYAGQDCFVHTRKYDCPLVAQMSAIPTFKPLIDQNKLHILRVLPCGLAIGSLDNPREHYIMDIVKEQYILVDTTLECIHFTIPLVMLDDYGERHAYDDYNTMIASAAGAGRYFGFFLETILV